MDELSIPSSTVDAWVGRDQDVESPALRKEDVVASGGSEAVVQAMIDAVVLAFAFNTLTFLIL